MKAEQLTLIEQALRDHIVNGLIHLYKMAGVGDNKLKLHEHSIEYSDGATYEVYAIEMDFSSNSKGDMVIYQREEETRYKNKNDIYNLDTLEMLQLLEAVEIV